MTEDASRTTQLPCRYLRSKEMYHQEHGQSEDDFSSGIYWCTRTQECLGPDGAACGQAECCATRACYLT